MALAGAASEIRVEYTVLPRAVWPGKQWTSSGTLQDGWWWAGTETVVPPVKPAPADTQTPSDHHHHRRRDVFVGPSRSSKTAAAFLRGRYDMLEALKVVKDYSLHTAAGNTRIDASRPQPRQPADRAMGFCCW